uniref:Uncharacterized protein n=1 Tax=Fervidicoccus fontis TaxID=683846 RepID=A0A7J3ZKA4_9CREN
MQARSFLKMIARMGVNDAKFLALSNKVAFAGTIGFLGLYPSILFYNMLVNIPLSQLPSDVLLRVLEPVILVNSLMCSIFVAIVVTSLVDTEKSEHVLEYLFAYMPCSIKVFLLSKAVSTALLAIPMTLPYFAGTYIVLYRFGVANAVLLLSAYLPAVVMAVPLTLLLLLFTFIMSQKYTAILRFALIMVAVVGLGQLANLISKEEASLSVSIAIPCIASILMLVATTLIYIKYSDMLIEKAIR